VFTIVNIGTLSVNKFWGETERQRSPSSTCTLLERGSVRLIVDPSPAPQILEERLFATTGLRPSSIDMVFVTHHHGDHRFGLDLFDGKPWTMSEAGLRDWRDQSPGEAATVDRFTPAEHALPPWALLMPTPGHTRSHCSLRVETHWGTLVVAGDAVMTQEFFAAEDGFHNSADFDLVRTTIRKIKDAAELVIPGHGNMIINRREGR
jgi:glyoxylase-like metal-dependent hydrolase (beta-lactamase superfamily II)